eukprot:1157733-Pelagomonas_calceolata.AAC.9
MVRVWAVRCLDGVLAACAADRALLHPLYSLEHAQIIGGGDEWLIGGAAMRCIMCFAAPAACNDKMLRWYKVGHAWSSPRRSVPNT